MNLTENRSLAFWICAAVTCLNAVISAGFSVARLLGPEGGEDGGQVVVAGTPEQVMRNPKSYTARALVAQASACGVGNGRNT